MKASFFLKTEDTKKKVKAIIILKSDVKNYYFIIKLSDYELHPIRLP